MVEAWVNIARLPRLQTKGEARTKFQTFFNLIKLIRVWADVTNRNLRQPVKET